MRIYWSRLPSREEERLYIAGCQQYLEPGASIHPNYTLLLHCQSLSVSVLFSDQLLKCQGRHLIDPTWVRFPLLYQLIVPQEPPLGNTKLFLPLRSLPKSLEKWFLGGCHSHTITWTKTRSSYYLPTGLELFISQTRLMENQMKERERFHNHIYPSNKSNGFNFAGTPFQVLGHGCVRIVGSSFLSLFLFSLKAVENQTQELGETYLFIVGKGLGEVVQTSYQSGGSI